MILFLDIVASRDSFQMKMPNNLQALWTVIPEKGLSQSMVNITCKEVVFETNITTQ